MPHSIGTEVCIVGGGPTGLATAITLRQAGFDVIVVDHAHPPIDKACGEGILPDGLIALGRLGVQPNPSQCAPFVGICFHNGAQQVEAKFCNSSGLGVRRILLHQLLIDAATRAGARLLWGRHLVAISESGVQLDGQDVRCHWIVGADGHNSRVRRLSGLDDIQSERVRFGFRQHYRMVPWSQFVEVHWSDCGQVYVTPVSDDAVCIAFITSSRTMRLNDAMARFPTLSCRLKNAVPEDPIRGAVTVSRRLKGVYRNNVVLVGEAAGSVDAITGQGLAVAFQQANALPAALLANDLSLFQTAHQRIMRLPRFMSGLMLSMDTHATFRRRVFRALESQPRIFAQMLAIHTGTAHPVTFGFANTLSLGWRLLTERT